MTNKPEHKDPFDGAYLGNIFGWKISLIGLVVIVLMTGIMAYRYYFLGVPIMETDASPPKTTTSQPIEKDTIQ